MRPEPTEIRIDEHGDETHESWLLIHANRMHGSTRLFGSEITHQQCITVTISRCSRKRDLNRDWLHSTKQLLEMWMSEAQWGAFVSSFHGTGVPATLTYLTGEGMVPQQAAVDSRLDKSLAEVRNAADKSLEEIKASYGKVMEAFETGGKKVQREALRDLGIRLGNAPSNMTFAARSLQEHVENVVTKARADIEGMVLQAQQQGALTEPVRVFELESGDAEVTP